MSTQLARPERLFSRRALTKLIWPLIVEQALAIMVGMSDSVMVSSAGEAAMSGVALVDMISVLLINIFAALATGGAVVTSQFVGAKDMKTARESTDQLVLTTVALSLVITTAVLLFQKPILRGAFGKVEADVMENCLIYLSITGLSYPFIALYNSAAAIFRSIGNSAVSMRVSLLMNAINIAGNAVLIYGLRMGVSGVAIPTLVSRVVAAVLMVALLRRKSCPVQLGPLHKLRPKKSLILRMLTIGIPNAVENGMFQFGKIIVIAMIAGFGTAQIAANTMANNIATLALIASNALNLAIVTVVGQCVGAQDFHQVRHYASRFTLLSTCFIAVSCALVWLGLPVFLRMYNASAEASGYVKTVITLNCLASPLLWAVSFTLPGALRACNDVRYTSIVAVVSMWAMRVGMSWVLGVCMGMGVVGVWISMVLDWIIRGAFYLPRFLSGGWKRWARLEPPVHMQKP